MLAFPRLTTPRVRTYLYYFTLVTVLFQLQPCYSTDFPRTFLNGQFTGVQLMKISFQLQPCYSTDFPRTFLNGQFTGVQLMKIS